MKPVYFLIISFLLVVGCGKQESTGNQEDKKNGHDNVTDTKLIDIGSLDSSEFGTITGKILFEGTPPTLGFYSNITKCNKCEKEDKEGRKIPKETLVVGKEKGIKDCIVYIAEGLEKYKFIVPPGLRTLDQSLCRYEPHVITLMAGQTLQVTNSDPCEHNINGSPLTISGFNFIQPENAKPDTKTFEKPEPKPFKVKCNIHDWMEAWIHVLPHPKFVVTRDDGAFEIPSLPAGNYKVAVWHERLGTIEFHIQLEKKGSVTKDLSSKDFKRHPQ